ncbi:hypothetical protein BDQ17DRAFT_143978 [Cyathus striatus]|nr:hypothetical protein BDQ17DRAFT_143978 [Cyathus striatus]
MKFMRSLAITNTRNRIGGEAFMHNIYIHDMGIILMSIQLRRPQLSLDMLRYRGSVILWKNSTSGNENSSFNLGIITMPHFRSTLLDGATQSKHEWLGIISCFQQCQSRALKLSSLRPSPTVPSYVLFCGDCLICGVKISKTSAPIYMYC